MELIKHIEATPLGFDELKRMLGPDLPTTQLIEYDSLASVQNAADLFQGGTKAVIVLLKIEGPDAPEVGHWIAMLDHGDTYEHFDSYGLTMDEELSITHEKPYLSQLFTNGGKPLVETGIQLQKIREHTNTCGRWAVARVRLIDLDPHQFAEIIGASHATPDVTVSLMTLFL